MSGPSRRDFLRRAAGAVPGAAIAGSLGVGACGPGGGDGDGASGAAEGASREAAAYTLPPVPLRAVADIVLPVAALGEEGVAEAVGGFTTWVEAFEPAAELDHPYLTGELRYGPPHPGPRWAAQLDALDLESRRRFGVPFGERSAEERRAVVERALGAEPPDDLPGSPARADHVALGLLAWFYGTPRANDLCYRAEVGRHRCRGIASLPDEPRTGEGA